MEFSEQKKKVVSIGGGTGQAMLLKGLKKQDIELTAVVTVLDSGRSTGEIRKGFNMVAPGDVRNCIIALSEEEKEFNDIFLHRFKGHFEGMNVGNLVLAALTEMKGSFAEAVEDFSKLFKLKGNVYPSTLTDTHICAELEDGKTICGESEIVKPGKSPVKRIFLQDNNVKGYEKAVQAIKNADYIIVGPGGLYTSLIVNFLIEDIRKAFLASRAKKIYIPNLATQPGVTDEFNQKKHFHELLKYIAGNDKKMFEKKIFDYVIINSEKPPKSLIDIYKKAGADFIQDLDFEEEIKKAKSVVIKGDFIDHNITKEWAKPTYMRHDPEKITKAIIETINIEKKFVGVILAAGTGSRMKPFSLSTSKVMLEFLGKPLLSFHIEEFLKNGIKKILIICSENNLQEIKGYYEGKYRESSIQYRVQKEQLGPANALLCAEDLLRNSYFILKYGDSISKEDQIKGILDTFKNSKEKNGTVTLRDVDNPSEYGVARFDDGRLVEIVEKPQSNPPSKLANVGLTILDGEKFFDALNKYGFKEIIPPAQYLLKEKYTLGYWISTSERADVGRAHDILNANKLLIEKFGGENKSNHVAKNSNISPESYVGQNAIIENSTKIEGYSSVEGYIGAGTLIKNSVIMHGSRIGKKCTIINSVIGKNNIIEDGFKTNVKETELLIKNKYHKPNIPVGVFTGNNVIIKKNLFSDAGKFVFPNKIISKNITQDKLIRAIIFDADNTIYDTKATTPHCDLEVMKYFSKMTSISSETFYHEWKEIVKKLITEKDPEKRQRKYSYGLLLQKHNVKNKDKLLAKGQEILKDEIEKRIKLVDGFNGIKKILQAYKLAVCSEDTSDLQKMKLKKFGLENFFEIAITSDKVGEMKPSKKYYDLLFKKLDVDPSECLFIGDSYEKDLEIPKKMGATTVLISEKSRQEPDFNVKNYKELEKLLKEI